MQFIFRLLFITLATLSSLYSEQLQKVSLQLQWFDQFQFAGYYVAKEKGFYEDAGLDVSLLKFENSILPIKSILSGSATYGVGRSNLIIEKSNGKSVVLLASILQSSASVFVTTKDSNISTVKDFVGKRIMLSDDVVSDLGLRAMINKKNVPTGNIVVQKNSYDINDLINHKTDLMAAYLSNEPFLLEQKGVKYTIFDPKDYGLDVYSDILFTSQEEMNNNPQRVEAFTQASLKGWRYAFENIEETVALILEKYNSQNKSKEALLYEAAVLKKLAYANGAELGQLDMTKIEKIYDYYSSMGLIEKKIDFKSFVYQVKKPQISFSEQEREFILKHPEILLSDVQWEPFSSISGGNNSGVFKEYYDEIQKVSGLKFSFVQIGNAENFQLVLDALKEKKIDMIDGTGKTDARGEYALFAGPFMQVSLGIASLRDNPYTTLNSLESKKIAMASGGTAMEFIYQHFKNAKIYETESVDKALSLLSHRKIDAVIDNLAVVDYGILRYNNSNLLTTQIDDYDFKIYALIRSDYPLLQSIMQKSIEYIRSQEEIKINNTIINDALYRVPKQVSLSIAQKQYLSEKKEITMCVDPEWEPFESIDEKGVHQGIAADLIRLVSERTGVAIKLIKTATWEESLELSKTNKCDILSFLNQTPQREQWLIFSDTLLSDPNVIITREDHPYVVNLSEVHNETVALPQGTMLEERLRKDFPSLKIISAKTEEESMSMVSQKKADMTIRSLIVSENAIRKEGLFNLKIAGQPNNYENIFSIGVLKSEPILISILNKGIHSITDEEKEQIVNKHTAIVLQKESDEKVLKAAFYGTIFLLMVLALISLWNTLLRKKVKQEVTKNIEIKEQLFQKSKQAEISNLIAGISHQWREPLSKLSSINLITIAKLKNGIPIDNETMLKQSDEIEKTIDFMSVTMQNFLMFYKKSTTKINFSALKSIEASLSIIETKLIDNSVTMEINGDEGILLYGIENEWMQVWLNLINNSIAIFIERKIATSKITINVTNEKITFCDNGGGMNMEQKHHGLGINMCHDIVSKYEKTFHLQNFENGICATILLMNIKTKS